ncbi:MAG: hypothetical protein WCK02_12275 [Bacteroidota bacterium]
MKKVFYSILGLTIISAVIITSCKKESTQNSTDKIELKSQLVEKFKVVGEQHNLSLASVYNDMKSQEIDLSSKEKFANQFEISLNKFFSKSTLINNSNSTCIDYKGKCKYYFKTQLTSKNKSGSSEEYNDSLINNSDFSANLKGLLLNLTKFPDNDNLTISQFNIFIDSLNNVAVQILDNENELNIYFTASSVAKASFEYWANNLDNWVVMIGSNKKDPASINNGVLGADVGGAVGGAIGAAVTGPGIAVGAFVGASACSTGKVVENLWNYFF